MVVEWHLNESELEYYTHKAGGVLVQEEIALEEISSKELNRIAQELKQEESSVAPPPPGLESFLRKVREEKRKFLKLAVNPDSHNQGE